MQTALEQKLRLRIEELEEEILSLKSAFTPETYSIPLGWKLTQKEATVFSCLIAREIANKEMIYHALYSGTYEVHSKIIDVFICKLRNKLKPFGVEIETVWGRGYHLRDRLRYHNNLMGAA